MDVSQKQFEALKPTSSSYFTRHRRDSFDFVMHHRDPSCLRGREGVHNEHGGGEVVTHTASVPWEDSWPCPNCYHVSVPAPRAAPPKPGRHLSNRARLQMHFDNADPERMKLPSMIFARSTQDVLKRGGKLSADTVRRALRNFGENV